MRENKTMNINKLQSRISILTTALVFTKIITWIALCGICILAIMHINEHGLKHLLETIWLGR